MDNNTTRYKSFRYKGNTYYLNTAVQLKDKYVKMWGLNNPKVYIIKIIKHRFNDSLTYYVGRYPQEGDNMNFGFKNSINAPPEEFIEKIIIPVSTPHKTKYRKDSDVNELLSGWIWYILIILFACLMVNKIIVWIAVSICFFSWRHKKLKIE